MLPLSLPPPEELAPLAAAIRRDTWLLADRWVANHRHTSPRGVLALEPGSAQHGSGEITAFLAAIAHVLDLAALDPDARAQAATALQSPELRDVAATHARELAAIGATHRELLEELIGVRTLLLEHLGADPSIQLTPASMQLLNSLFDSVVIEAADQFYITLTHELVRRAERDPLTGLLNRQAFHEQLDRELARAERYGHSLTLVTLDLDAFKQVNDTLGHLAGDAVISRLATLLTTHTRDGDLVGRLGGDEFAVALLEADARAAMDLVRRIRIHLVPARRQLDLPRKFGVSFGAASFPDDGTTVEELLFASDQGLYRAKGSGTGSRMLEAGAHPTVGRVRVLVADDDPGIRVLCGSLLEHAGFDPLYAADGAAAIAACQEHPPDVLLLDVDMPRASGWDVIDALNADADTAGIPVVMLTGSADQESVTRAEAGGAIEFVSKPFDPVELVRVVHRVLEWTAAAEVMDTDVEPVAAKAV